MAMDCAPPRAPAEPLVMRRAATPGDRRCCGRCRRRARRRTARACARAARHRADERAGDGVGVALHRRDGAVDLERAGTPAGVDEEVDAHRGQLLRLAPGGAERLGLERGEGAEEALLERRARRILHEVDGELGQRARDEVRLHARRRACARRSIAVGVRIGGIGTWRASDMTTNAPPLARPRRVVTREQRLLLGGQRVPQRIEPRTRSAHISSAPSGSNTSDTRFRARREAADDRARRRAARGAAPAAPRRAPRPRRSRRSARAKACPSSCR